MFLSLIKEEKIYCQSYQRYIRLCEEGMKDNIGINIY